MILFRSLLFNVLFYATLIVMMILCLPMLLLPQALLIRTAPVWWARISIWLLRVIAGTRVEFRGLRNLPKTGCLVVSKHQSFLETFCLISVVNNPAIILKRELQWIPIFGWYLSRTQMIPINRGARAAAMAAMNERSRTETQRGRHILIFAEGTRRPPGAPPAYKQGFSHLYDVIEAPIQPVALNTGLFWPRRQFIRRPGTAVIEFLPVVPSGLPREEAFAQTRDAIEAACERLLEEGRKELGEAAYQEAMAWKNEPAKA